MSQLDRITLKETFNNASTGLYKAGQSRGIGSDDHRLMVEHLADSSFNLTTDAFTGAQGLKNSINTIANLKAVVTVGLSVPLYTQFRDTGNGNVLRVYELVSGTDAEVSPDVIRPSDYAASTNEKVWKLLVSFSYESFTVTASGTDTYTATLVPAIVAYAANQKVFIKFTNANTGAATINLNGLGAKSIRKSGGTALSAGDISANQILCLVYDGTNFQVVGGGGGGTSLTDPLLFKGVVDCSANPNYPAADAGDVYKVSVAGKIGGGSGPNVEVGDTLLCTVDASPSGNHATVGANWVILQTNLEDATPSVKGIAKLYADLSASNTDGSVTQAGIKTAVELLQFPPGRSISSDAAVVQNDNNSILFLNGTFNITIDALVQWSTISILNEGAGTITLINGTGVTFTGPSSIASGETAMILYKTSTAPVVIKSGGGSGSVTSVGLTTGTTGTDVNVSGSPVTSSGVITLNIPTSSATNRGLLNSSDWSTFNSKQSAITFGTGVQTWLGIPSWDNFLAAITGTAPYYSLANGGTVTGVNTITSNAANQLIKAGMFTAIATGNFFERIAPVMTAFGGTPNELYGVQIRPTMNAVGTNGIQIACDISPTFSGGTSPYNTALRVQGLSIFNTANSSGYNGVLYAPTAGTAGRVAIFGFLEITTSAGPVWTTIGIQVPGSGRTMSIWGATLSNVLDFASIVLKGNAYSANRAGADLSIVSIDQPSYTLATFTANSLSLLSSTSAWPTLTTPLTTAYGINLSPSAPGNATTNIAINTNANAGRVQFGHDVKLMNVGSGFYIKEGTNATMGVATLVAGTVTVNTNKVTANSRIMLTRQNLGTITVPVGLAISARTAGTSFTILSGDLTDTSQVAWQILEPS